MTSAPRFFWLQFRRRVGIIERYPGVAQLVARVVWDHQAGRSSRPTRTSSSQASYRLRRAFFKSTSLAHSAAPRFPHKMLRILWGSPFEQALYRLLRRFFKRQSALAPLLLLSPQSQRGALQGSRLANVISLAPAFLTPPPVRKTSSFSERFGSFSACSSPNDVL